jgi:hypothetical protein
MYGNTVHVKGLKSVRCYFLWYLMVLAVVEQAGRNAQAPTQTWVLEKEKWI